MWGKRPETSWSLGGNSSGKLWSINAAIQPHTYKAIMPLDDFLIIVGHTPGWKTQ